MGTRKIARVLCRAGLHLGATTVRRMLAEKGGRRTATAVAASTRIVTAKRPDEVWHAAGALQANSFSPPFREVVAVCRPVDVISLAGYGA